jgi:hypothetical protein
MNNNEIDDGLTEAERAALAEEDDVDLDLELDPEAQDPEGTDDENGSEDKQGDDAGESGKGDEPNPADGEDAGKTGAEEEQQPAPIHPATPQEDFQAKLDVIQAQKQGLIDQFDNGDITAKEYQNSLDALAREERAIERAQDRAEYEIENKKKEDLNAWASMCASFLEENDIYKTNPRLYKAFDAEVRDLANDPKTAGWSGQKFLQEAHKNIKEAFNIPDKEGADSKTTKTPRPRPELPPNLAKVPAADFQDVKGGRFAGLDRLATSDPIAYEEALDKMTPADRDAYLAAG